MGAHLFENVAARSFDVAGDGFGRLVGVMDLREVDQFPMLAENGRAPGEGEVEAAADGAQHLAMLPPEHGRVPVVVTAVHDRVKRRVQLAVPQRIGEVVFLDQALEALELGDVLFGRHADEPAGQGRLDQNADLVDVADEVLVDRPHPRAAVQGEGDEAFPPEELERLANRVRGGAVTAREVGATRRSFGFSRPSMMSSRMSW